MSRPKSTMTWSAARDCLPISKVATVAAEVRACLKIAFGVPPLGGTAPEPPKGGTPNLRLRISVGFFRHALSAIRVCPSPAGLDPNAEDRYQQCEPQKPVSYAGGCGCVAERRSPTRRVA